MKPAPKIANFAARLAIVCSIAAFVLLLSLHILSPEYSPAWRMISEYANGQFGWMLSLMFAGYGLGELALAVAMCRTSVSRLGLVFLSLSGVGATSAAVFDLKQSAPHDVAGVIGILCLPVGAMLISRTQTLAPAVVVFAANLTWISLVLLLASFALMVATFVLALGSLPSTPPDTLPAGVIALVGWADRLILLSTWFWVILTAWHAQHEADRRIGLVAQLSTN